MVKELKERWECSSATHTCSEDPCNVEIPPEEKRAKVGEGKLIWCPPCQDLNGEMVLFRYVGDVKYD